MAGDGGRPPEVAIRRPDDPLEEIVGPVVLLDVFRASNTILALLAAGAAEVLLVADADAALRIGSRHPAWLVLGERGGTALPGFDGGNSPAHDAARVRPGQTVVLTTSAGTREVHRLRRADPVLVGSFANAAALLGHLAGIAPGRVTLLPMGLEARSPAVEDDEAAAYLAARLSGQAAEFRAVRERILTGPGAARLRRLGQHDDLRFCMTLDSHDVVPTVVVGDPPRARLSG